MVLNRSPECIGYAELEQPWKYMTICCMSFHPCISITKQIWQCHKNGQGQPSDIIWTNLVILEYPMLFTKFQGHRQFRSREEDFLRFKTYMGMAVILVMWPGSFEQTFVPPSHGGFIWNLTLTGQAVSEEQMFKSEDDRQRWMTDDVRRRPTYPYKLTSEPSAQPLDSGKKRFLKGFTIYGPGSNLGHVTRNIWTNFHLPWRLNMKFGFNRLSVFCFCFFLFCFFVFLFVFLFVSCCCCFFFFFRKRSLKMLSLSDRGQKSVIDLVLWYSQSFVY